MFDLALTAARKCDVISSDITKTLSLSFSCFPLHPFPALFIFSAIMEGKKAYSTAEYPHFTSLVSYSHPHFLDIMGEDGDY